MDMFSGRCNGIPECDTDEVSCPPQCGADQFQCNDGTCIDKDNR